MSSVLADRHGWWFVFIVAGLFALPLPSSAQDELGNSPQTVTTSDATIPVDSLHVMLRPFDVDDYVFGIGYDDDDRSSTRGKEYSM